MGAAFFIFRIVLAWGLVYLFVAVCLSGLEPRFQGPDGGLLVALCFILLGFVAMRAVAHVRRVRLIGGPAAPLSNRQRQRIELPLDPGQVFELLDGAVRDLPGSVVVDSVRSSLQVAATLARDGRHMRIHASVLPNGAACSVTLICEPARGTWSDSFLVDDGASLENAEAIARALAHGVALHRGAEQQALRRSESERAQSVARLTLLHAQVEPHFLYNTLASAQLLTRSDPARADAMLGSLILYLRHSLPRDGDTPSTLGQELERARAYLDILRIRMGERLQLSIDVAPALLALRFPAMMLQTLVENAIKHGLEPKSGGGTVWIIARAIGECVAVTVADDGCGLAQAPAAGGGIGLANVRERLQLAYGGSASFVIGANFPAGAAATITLPMASLSDATAGRVAA